MRSPFTFSALAVLALWLVTATAVGAQTPRPRPPADPARDRPLLQAMFSEPKIDSARFASSFTDAVPLENVQAAIDTYKAALGTLQSIEPTGPDELLTFSRGTLRASTAYDANGKLTGLLFHDEISAANKAALVRLLTAQKADPAWFSSQFLSHVGGEQLDGLLERLHAAAGSFVRVDTRDGSYVSVFTKASYPTQISTDAQGKIDNLGFRAESAAGSAGGAGSE